MSSLVEELARRAAEDPYEPNLRAAIEGALDDPGTVATAGAEARLRLALVRVLHRAEQDVEAAGRVADAALGLGEEAADPVTWLRLLNYRGFLFNSQGRFVDAVEPLVAAMHRGIALGRHRAVSQAATNLADTLLSMGSGRAALRALDRAPDAAWATDRSKIEYGWIRFRALVEVGREDEAAAEVDRVREALARFVAAGGDGRGGGRRTGAPDPRMPAALEAMEGQLDQVRGESARALARLAPLVQTPHLEPAERVHVGCVATSAALDHGDLGEARRLVDIAQALCQRADTALDQSVLVLAARIARAEGDAELAFDMLQAAASMHRRRYLELAEGSVLTFAERHLAASERRDADLESMIEALRRTQAAAERSRQQAQAASEQLRQIADALPLQIGYVDPDGVLRFANATLQAAFGRKVDHVVGERMEELLAGEAYAGFREGLAEALAGRCSRQTLPVDMGEAIRHVEATWLPAEGSHRGGAYVLASDVTDRLAREQQVLQTQKLESLGALASGLAHDFNNLLTGIVANVDFARSGISEPESAAALDDALLAANHASELTRQLQAYAGQGSLRRQPMDLNQVVDEAWIIARAGIDRRTPLELELDPSPPWAVGDPAQIGQVCVNLLVNAAEGCDVPHGRITVRTGRLRHDGGALAGAVPSGALAAGAYGWIEVVDTGEGIAPDQLGRIFEPFYSTRGPGRGLGLATCLGIVRSHEGVLVPTSHPGRGTTVRVVIPAADAPGTPPSDAPARAGLTGRALVVDDDPLVRRLLERMLTRQGLGVATASDGRQALRQLAEGQFDVVFLDLTMPVMDGARTLQELRKSHDLPVVLMSGYSEANVRALRGAQGFLAKPFTAASVQQVLGEVLRS